MPHPDQAHLRRDRAESFGAVAQAYDRFRPSYPAVLMDRLAVLAAAWPALDIGCGTGKAAVLLAARGVDLTGVEVDPQMAQIARGHGLTVEVGSFEEWDDAGRTFGLITAAQAWHWVDPQRGAVKVGRLLRPGGSFVPFWNRHDLEPSARAVADEVYRRVAPELVPPADAEPLELTSTSHHAENLRTYGRFDSVETRWDQWQETVPVPVYLGRIGTHSDHLALGPERLAALQDELGEALAAGGESVTLVGGTFTVTASVAG